MKSFSRQRLLRRHFWTPWLMSFTLTKPEFFTFSPGQYARLGIPHASGSGVLWRPFSFVSAPHEEWLEFFVVLVPGGLFSSHLRHLLPGANLLLDHEHYGFMTIDRFQDGDQLWMISTGTGLAPYISILRDPMVWRRFRRVFLIHGVRHLGDIAYSTELETMCSVFGKQSGTAELHLTYCISADRAAEDKVYLSGRLTDAWDNGKLERACKAIVTPARSRVILCGNPGMVEDMRKRLHHRGLKPCRRLVPGEFLTESYW